MEHIILCQVYARNKISWKSRNTVHGIMILARFTPSIRSKLSMQKEMPFTVSNKALPSLNKIHKKVLSNTHQMQIVQYILPYCCPNIQIRYMAIHNIKRKPNHFLTSKETTCL